MADKKAAPAIDQFPLQLPPMTSYDAHDFIVTDANKVAYGHLIAGMPLVGLGGARASGAVLYGPEAAGKTHLSHIWMRMMSAKPIEPLADLSELDVSAFWLMEDVDRHTWTYELESWFYALSSRLLSGQGFILLVARTPPAEWPLDLADWRSRARSLPAYPLESPDDATLEIVLTKLAADRQLVLPDKAIHFLLPRMERSYKAAHRLIKALDETALASGSRVKMTTLKTILTEFGWI